MIQAFERAAALDMDIPEERIDEAIEEFQTWLPTIKSDQLIQNLFGSSARKKKVGQYHILLMIRTLDPVVHLFLVLRLAHAYTRMLQQTPMANEPVSPKIMMAVEVYSERTVKLVQLAKELKKEIIRRQAPLRCALDFNRTLMRLDYDYSKLSKPRATTAATAASPASAV